MTREEKAEALIEQAEGRGLLVNYDSGFLVVSRSASADQRRYDAAEVEQSIIEMGTYLRDVFSLAIGRARGVRGKDFIDRQVFIPSSQIVGTFAGCTAKGIVDVSYNRTNAYDRTNDPERIYKLNSSVPGDDLLILVPSDGPEQASPSFSWIAEENIRRLFEYADAAGVSLEHDSGFTLVKWWPTGDVDGDSIIRKLGKSMREVSAHTVAQARIRRGSAFVGKRVFVPEFNAFGVLASSDVDGGLTVSYHDKRTDSDQTCYCHGSGLLVIDGIVAGDEEMARAASAGPKSAEKNWIRRTFGG